MILQDYELPVIAKFLNDLERPPEIEDNEFESFVKAAMYFFVDSELLWRKHDSGAHKLVIFPLDRLRILKACHDDVSHRGVFAIKSLLLE